MYSCMGIFVLSSSTCHKATSSYQRCGWNFLRRRRVLRTATAESPDSVRSYQSNVDGSRARLRKHNRGCSTFRQPECCILSGKTPRCGCFSQRRGRCTASLTWLQDHSCRLRIRCWWRAHFYVLRRYHILLWRLTGVVLNGITPDVDLAFAGVESESSCHDPQVFRITCIKYGLRGSFGCCLVL